MTPPHLLSRLFPAFFCSSAPRLRQQTLACLLAICGLSVSSGLHANNLNNYQYGSYSFQASLPKWPKNKPAPLPNLDQLEELFTQPQALQDEAAKQAQSRYLASKYQKNPKDIRQLVELAWAESAKRSSAIKPELLMAIMQKESALRPKIQNRYGAQGLMQVVRRWHRDKLHPSESLLDPAVNIRVGADILEEYLEDADGNLTKALAKYSGNARGYSKKILMESRKLAKMAEQATLSASSEQTVLIK